MIESTFSEEMSLGEVLLALKELEEDFRENADAESLATMFHLIREMEVPILIDGPPPTHEAHA
tara:strand:+ start:516 stop:704 length:189 start_codon:yes stop_codon:yes gene_type:complete